MNRVLKQIGLSVAEVVLFIGIMGMTYAIVGAFALHLNLADLEDFDNPIVDDPYSLLFLTYLPVFIGSIISVLVVHHIIFKRPLSFSGITKHGIIKQFSVGFIWSALLLTLGFVILYALDMMSITSVNMVPNLFFGFLLLFFIQSSFEEIAIRSFLLPTLSHRFNIWIGLIISSIVFAALHYNNQNASFLSIFNIFVAGLLLGIIYLRYKQIWAPIGLHMGWNFLQGSFFGWEVSGIEVYSYIDSEEVGPDLWTGGAFGFEGSLLAAIFLSALSVWIWRQAPENFKGKLIVEQNPTSQIL